MGAKVCSQEIIKLKDSMHRAWFNLQQLPQKIDQGPETLINKQTLKELLEKAVRAKEIGQGEDCQVNRRFLGKIDENLGAINSKLGIAESKHLPGAGNYWRLFKDQATELIVTDINRLINSVHNAGYSLIEMGEGYAGCAIGYGENIKEVNSGALNYCEGVPGKYRKKGYLRQGGTSIEHRLGAHKAVIEFTEGLDGYEVNLEYTESGDHNWNTRRAGVINFLEKKGLACEFSGLSTRCKGVLKEPDHIREIAYFLGGITDADLAPEDCTRQAVEYAGENAEDKVKEFGNEAWKYMPYPNDHSGWLEHCGIEEESEEEREELREIEREEHQKRRQERREEREARILQRLQEKADMLGAIMSADRIKALQPENCLQYGYWLIKVANSTETMLGDVCDRIWDQDTYEGKQCQRNIEHEHELNVETAKQLLNTCPVEGVIHNIEKTWHTPSSKSKQHKPISDLLDALIDVEAVCRLAGEFDPEHKCYQELNAAMIRAKEGSEQLPLQLHKKLHPVVTEDIQQSIKEEKQAVNKYIERATHADDLGAHDVAELFREISGDELNHNLELEGALSYGPHEI